MEAGKQQRLLLFHVLNWNGEKGRVLAEEMSAYNGYETTSDIGYPTPGSFDSYVEAKGIAMVTLEMPMRTPQPVGLTTAPHCLRQFTFPWVGPPTTNIQNDRRRSDRRTENEVRQDFSGGDNSKPLPPERFFHVSPTVERLHSSDPCSSIDGRNSAHRALSATLWRPVSMSKTLKFSMNIALFSILLATTAVAQYETQASTPFCKLDTAQSGTTST